MDFHATDMPNPIRIYYLLLYCIYHIHGYTPTHNTILFKSRTSIYHKKLDIANRYKDTFYSLGLHNVVICFYNICNMYVCNVFL